MEKNQNLYTRFVENFFLPRGFPVGGVERKSRYNWIFHGSPRIRKGGCSTKPHFHNGKY
jgi:hypothetical protein